MTCKEATYREVIKIHGITGTVARELNETTEKKRKQKKKTEIKNSNIKTENKKIQQKWRTQTKKREIKVQAEPEANNF